MLSSHQTSKMHVRILPTTTDELFQGITIGKPNPAKNLYLYNYFTYCHGNYDPTPLNSDDYIVSEGDVRKNFRPKHAMPCLMNNGFVFHVNRHREKTSYLIRFTNTGCLSYPLKEELDPSIATSLSHQPTSTKVICATYDRKELFLYEAIDNKRVRSKSLMSLKGSDDLVNSVAVLSPTHSPLTTVAIALSTGKIVIAKYDAQDCLVDSMMIANIDANSQLFSTSNGLLLAYDGERTLRIWNSNNLGKSKDIQLIDATNISVSSTGHYLTALKKGDGYVSDTVYLLQLDPAQLFVQLQTVKLNQPVSDLIINNRGQVVTAENMKISVFPGIEGFKQTCSRSTEIATFDINHRPVLFQRSASAAVNWYNQPLMSPRGLGGKTI